VEEEMIDVNDELIRFAIGLFAETQLSLREKCSHLPIKETAVVYELVGEGLKKNAELLRVLT
jgi:hypothetical protein